MKSRAKAIAILQPKRNKIIITIVGAAVAALLVAVPLVHADRFDEQISELRQENAGAEAELDDLAVAAQNLEDKIASLRAEIAAIEGQIQENKAKRDSVKAEIAKAEAQLAKERDRLGVNIKQMYVEGEMSTVEMLASSRDLSEFVDREQYRTSVQNKITATMERIEALKQKLADKKAKIEKLLKDQEAMRGDLAEKRAEADRLLALNEAEQAEFNEGIEANNDRIAELRRQQAIENARYNIGEVSYVGSGSYPWAGVPFPNSMPDPWGMYKRQCVSYTAWKVASTGRHMPYWGGRGNANEWDDNARAAGIPTDYNPRPGDVAISNSGYYGHAMYVEKVHDDGTITVSQYNAGWGGRYSVVQRSTAGLVFIHF